MIVEPILGVAMLLFAEGSRLICGSRREYLNTLNVAVRIMIIVSVASMLLVRQISLQHWYNGLWLIVVGILLVGLKLFSLERLPHPCDGHSTPICQKIYSLSKSC